MTIITKLNMAKKNANKAIITLLAASAMLTAAPEAHETKTEPKKDSVLQVTDTKAQKQQMFKAAVKADLSYKEIAKYMDFPEFIHVTKDGGFDEVAAGDFFDAIVKENKKVFLNILGPNIQSNDIYNLFDKYAFAEILAKNNPETKQLLQNTKDTFTLTNEENNIEDIKETLKKQEKSIPHSGIYDLITVLSALLGVLGMGSSLIAIAVFGGLGWCVEGMLHVWKISVPMTLLAFASIKATNHYWNEKVSACHDPVALKPFYVEFEKSMHHVYLEQEVAKEWQKVSKEKQQLLEPIKKSSQQMLDSYDKNAKQQFQQLLIKSKQPQNE